VVTTHAAVSLARRATVGYSVGVHIARLYLYSRRGHHPKGPMVRLLVHEMMARRGISAYALSRGAELSYPSAYRLSRPGGSFGRLHADTLERLCRFFAVQPGALLEWVPPKRP
jgi:DNA-binding Xre family transcriptional regulator